jgi:hypothetical protein
MHTEKLEVRTKRNSQNSSKPPSSDIPFNMRKKKGSSDQSVPGLMKGKDLQFEELMISEPVSLSQKGFDFVIGALQRPR